MATLRARIAGATRGVEELIYLGANTFSTEGTPILIERGMVPTSPPSPPHTHDGARRACTGASHHSAFFSAARVSRTQCRLVPG